MGRSLRSRTPLPCSSSARAGWPSSSNGPAPCARRPTMRLHGFAGKARRSAVPCSFPKPRPWSCSGFLTAPSSASRAPITPRPPYSACISSIAIRISRFQWHRPRMAAGQSSAESISAWPSKPGACIYGAAGTRCIVVRRRSRAAPTSCARSTTATSATCSWQTTTCLCSAQPPCPSSRRTCI